jgi:hypothetical protein
MGRIIQNDVDRRDDSGERQAQSKQAAQTQHHGPVHRGSKTIRRLG